MYKSYYKPWNYYCSLIGYRLAGLFCCSWHHWRDAAFFPRSTSTVVWLIFFNYVAFKRLNYRLMIEQRWYENELCGKEACRHWWSATAGTNSECFPPEMPRASRAKREMDEGDGPWYPPCLRSQKVRLCGGTWEKSGGGKWFLIRSLDSPAHQTSAARFSFRSKGPTPIPSTQTQWNICSGIHDSSPEDFFSPEVDILKQNDLGEVVA